MVLAKDAVEKGMADRVESLDATLGRVVKGSRGEGVRAEVEENIGTATESLTILEVRERRLRLNDLA